MNDIKAVLFDLDGTLLPQDQDVFVKTYFGLLAKKLAPHGYDPECLIKAIWHGTGAMIANGGQKTNEEVFWDDFCAVFGERARQDMPLFEEFYENEFDGVQSVCGRNPLAAETVAELKVMGYRLVLATNPIFPSIATEKRIRWAGLEPSDFELYTTYENCVCSKPNPQYYVNIMQQLGLKPEECLMVGNDVSDDTAAERAGATVFLLTDCLINKDGRDISAYPQGDFNALMQYVKAIRGEMK